LGPEEITSRVRFVAQPDSPVGVTRLDLREATLTRGSGSHVFEKRYSAEVVNLSDRAVSNIQLRVQIRSGDGAAGGGPVVKGPLMPGEKSSVTTTGGRSHVTSSSSSDDVWLLVAVESVAFSDCVYKPSQSLAIR
jgi:hypothetical protein